MAAVKKTRKKENKTVAEPKTDIREEVKKAIERVGTTIPEPETVEGSVTGEDEALVKSEAHIEEMGRDMEKLQNRQRSLQEELEKNPDNAEEILKDELVKAREAYKKMTFNNAYYTNTWNGQSCY